MKKKVGIDALDLLTYAKFRGQVFIGKFIRLPDLSAKITPSQPWRRSKQQRRATRIRQGN